MHKILKHLLSSSRQFYNDDDCCYDSYDSHDYDLFQLNSQPCGSRAVMNQARFGFCHAPAHA